MATRRPSLRNTTCACPGFCRTEVRSGSFEMSILKPPPASCGSAASTNGSHSAVQNNRASAAGVSGCSAKVQPPDTRRGVGGFRGEDGQRMGTARCRGDPRRRNRGPVCRIAPKKLPGQRRRIERRDMEFGIHGHLAEGVCMGALRVHVCCNSVSKGSNGPMIGAGKSPWQRIDDTVVNDGRSGENSKKSMIRVLEVRSL